jgi:DNA-binding MarR family transcriptional regulator
MATTKFSETEHAAFLLLHNVLGLLTKLEETTYASKADVSYQQFLILVTVESSDPPVSQTTIARAIQRNLNSISMIVDRMEKQGLVNRIRSKEDRRETHVSLTDLGHRKLIKAIEVGIPLRERLGSVFTDEELTEWTRLMGKLKTQILKEMGREAPSAGVERASTQRVLSTLKRLKTAKRK